MKKTHWVSVLVALVAVVVLTADASAMYNPRTGRFLQRDPAPGGPMHKGAAAGQYRDGMNLYQYVGSAPTRYADPRGLKASTTQPCTCYCGPDVTHFLVNLVNYAGRWRRLQGAKSRLQGIQWLRANGMNLDWWSTAGPYKTAQCPSCNQCKAAYWLCGECVHGHWIGTFMYGYLGRLFSLPDSWMDTAADHVHTGAPGDNPNLNYSDPSWDSAGYGIARLAYDESTTPKGMRQLCKIRKSDKALWFSAHNTVAVPPSSGIDLAIYWINTTENWPSPHAFGYKKACKKCPQALPAAVVNLVPGGKCGNAFPNM